MTDAARLRTRPLPAVPICPSSRLDQAMTLNEALCCLTRDAAYAAHREHAIGSLEAAKWVGFIVIDQDLFAMPAADLHTLGAPHTWVAGRKV